MSKAAAFYNAQTFAGATLTSPTITDASLIETNQRLSADGAIAVTAGIVFVTKASLAHLTLAAPSSQDGLQLTIVSTTAFAHDITCATGVWDGTAGVNTVGTFAALAGACCTLIAKGTLWYVVSANQVTWAP